MGAEKRKLFRFTLIVLSIMGAGAAWVCFGENGLIHLYKTEMERQNHMDRIRKLARENQLLLEEIQRLRTDMKYVESVAKKELNLIRENEVVYRFNGQQAGRSKAGQESEQSLNDHTTKRSQREGKDDGKVR